MPISPRQIALLGTFNNDGTVTGVTSGTSQPIFAGGPSILSFYLRSIGTTSGGTVLIEEADWGPLEQPYSGTWGTLLSQAASGFTGGAQLIYHPPAGAYAWVRVRISSAITGGGTIIASYRDQGQA